APRLTPSRHPVSERPGSPARSGCSAPDCLASSQSLAAIPHLRSPDKKPRQRSSVMQFRIKQLSLAVGAALTAGISGHVFALAPADFNSTPGDTEEVWVSGSSGQDPGFATAVARMCVAGSLDKYNDGTAQTAFFCSINTT